jgi:hypothetical protein
MRARGVLTILCALGFASAACEFIASIQNLQGGAELDAGDAARDGPPTDAGADTAFDVAQVPCEPTAGKGTLCATIHTDPKDPPIGYDPIIGGVSTLGVNGKGSLVLYLFNQDPTGGCNPYVNLVPTSTIQVPPSGQTGEITVDQLPLTVVATAPPGQYWVFAYFQDDGPPPIGTKLMRRGTGINSILAGDLVTPVEVSTATYPTVTLKTEETTVIQIALEPLFGLEVEFEPTTGLESQAASDTSIKGDGPASIIVFDGTGITDPTGDFLSFAAIACVDLDLQGKAKSVTAVAPVVTTGTHQIYGSIYDYAPPDVCGNPLPAGTLESNENGIPVTISTTSWTSSVVLPILGLGPFGSGADSGVAPALCH